MENEQKNRPTTQYLLPHGWKINLSDKADLLQNNEGKVAIILKSKNFGDVSPVVFDVLENSIHVQSLPHLVERVSFTLDKEIEVTFNSFVYEQG